MPFVWVLGLTLSFDPELMVSLGSLEGVISGVRQRAWNLFSGENYSCVPCCLCILCNWYDTVYLVTVYIFYGVVYVWFKSAVYHTHAGEGAGHHFL